MNNVTYGLYFNTIIVFGWLIEMKTWQWIYSYGLMSVGILVCYFMDDIEKLIRRLNYDFKTKGIFIFLIIFFKLLFNFNVSFSVIEYLSSDI